MSILVGSFSFQKFSEFYSEHFWKKNDPPKMLICLSIGKSVFSVNPFRDHCKSTFLPKIVGTLRNNPLEPCLGVPYAKFDN